jgi:hypothetical protein
MVQWPLSSSTFPVTRYGPKLSPSSPSYLFGVATFRKQYSSTILLAS